MSDDNDELFKQFGDLDPDKIAIEAATKGLTDMFKAFRQQGLTIAEAATLVSILMKENENGSTEGNSES